MIDDFTNRTTSVHGQNRGGACHCFEQRGWEPFIATGQNKPIRGLIDGPDRSRPTGEVDPRINFEFTSKFFQMTTLAAFAMYREFPIRRIVWQFTQAANQTVKALFMFQSSNCDKTASFFAGVGVPIGALFDG